MSYLKASRPVRATLALCLVLSASLIVAFVGTSHSSAKTVAHAAAKGTPFVDLFIVDESGPSKLFAPANILGAEDGAKYLNAHGGILGHPVKVVVKNDNGDPGTAVSVLDSYLSSNPKPNLVYPGSESAEIAALDPILARQSIYAISNSEGVSGSLLHDKSYPDQFTIFTPTSLPAGAAAAWFKKQGIKKVGLLTQEVPYNEGDATAVKAALKKLGIGAVQATFPTSAVDVSAEVSALKSGGAQALYCGCLGPAIGYALSARSTLAWNVPVVANLGSSALDITKLAPAADLKNVHELVFRNDDSAYKNLPGTKYMLANGFAKKAGIAEISIAANGWDSLLIAADAATQAGAITGNAMATATEHFTGSHQCDPLYDEFACYVFSKTNHTETAPIKDYPIIPVGPVVAGIIR